MLVPVSVGASGSSNSWLQIVVGYEGPNHCQLKEQTKGERKSASGRPGINASSPVLFLHSYTVLRERTQTQALERAVSLRVPVKEALKLYWYGRVLSVASRPKCSTGPVLYISWFPSPFSSNWRHRLFGNARCDLLTVLYDVTVLR